MTLAWSRYSALVFAIGLAIGEAVINWANWQWWPLWVVDYGIVLWLVAGFWASRTAKRAHVLTTAWAFALGIFYLALFVTLDSIRHGAAAFEDEPVVIVLMAAMTIIAAVGVASSAYAQRCADRVQEPSP